MKYQKGKENYFKSVKSKFVKPKKNQSNLVFLGKSLDIDDSCNIGTLIVDIVQQYFEKATYDTNPISFIIEDDNHLRSIKEELISRNINFNDGYEHICFRENLFFKKPIINKKVIGPNRRATDSLEDISFKLRILSYSKYETISKSKLRPNMIYYFDKEIENGLENKSHIQISGLDTKQIKNIFNS
jgi:hypothetical protein